MTTQASGENRPSAAKAMQLGPVASDPSMVHQDPDGNLTPPGMMLTIYQACIMQAVDTPARVQDRIETTGGVDGQQTDSWDQYSARWTYQPEEGLTLTVWEA